MGREESHDNFSESGLWLQVGLDPHGNDNTGFLSRST